MLGFTNVARTSVHCGTRRSQEQTPRLLEDGARAADTPRLPAVSAEGPPNERKGGEEKRRKGKSEKKTKGEQSPTHVRAAERDDQSFIGLIAGK